MSRPNATRDVRVMNFPETAAWDAWSAEEKKQVRKIVLGPTPGDPDGKPIRIEAFPENFARDYPALTHLYVWRVEGLRHLPALPPNLECLDVRECPQLEAFAGIPSSLTVWVLERCPVVATLGPIPERFAALFDLSLQDCPRIRESVIRDLLAAAPELERFDASGCTQITKIRAWPPKLDDIRLDRCPGLSALPPTWPQALRRLQLRDTSLKELPGLPEGIDFLDLCGMRKLHRLPEGWKKARTLFLFRSGLLMPPASEHGAAYGENVAERTRDYFHDIDVAGEGGVKRCKVLVLGNGSAGKTCLSLALVGKDPKEAEILGSTHGVQFWPWEISATVGSTVVSVPVHVWDFGGQEIYHNTHRLFVSTGAVFIVVWRRSQDGKQPEPRENEPPDHWRPLRYWIDYIRLTCPHDPRIAVVCSCESGDPETLTSALVHEIGEADAGEVGLFCVDTLPNKRPNSPYRRSTHVAGGLDDLEDWLGTNVGQVIGAQGTVVPAHWEVAQDLVEGWIRKIDTDAVFASAYQQLPFEAFQKLLEEDVKRCSNEVKDPSSDVKRFPKLGGALKAKSLPMDESRTRRTLEFLTHSGWIYWSEHLSDRRAIIGQRWALDGIYTLLERHERDGTPSLVYLHLSSRRPKGQFTASKLNEWGWAGRYSEKEQELLISLMVRVGVCFPLVRKEESLWGDPVYLSLEHLDSRTAEWERRMNAFQADLAATGDPVRHDSLHQGHWDEILAELGSTYGTEAEYARDGFLLIRRQEKQAVLVTLNLDGTGMGGTIDVDARGENAAELRKRMLEFVTKKVRGSIEHTRESGGQPEEPAGKRSKAITVFFSYAWEPRSRPGSSLADSEPVEREIPVGYERPVQAIYDALLEENGVVEPIRDKNEIRTSDDIVAYMNRIKTTDKVLIVHSDRYWKSPFCMYEFTNLMSSFLSRHMAWSDVVILVGHRGSNLSKGSDFDALRCFWSMSPKEGGPDPHEMLRKAPNAGGLRIAALHALECTLPEMASAAGCNMRWDDQNPAPVIAWVKDRIGLNPKPPSP